MLEKGTVSKDWKSSLSAYNKTKKADTAKTLKCLSISIISVNGKILETFGNFFTVIT